jgi:hypothetical protein
MCAKHGHSRALWRNVSFFHGARKFFPHERNIPIAGWVVTLMSGS